LAYPFVGESLSRASYKPIDFESIVKAELKRKEPQGTLGKNFVYPGFYESTAKRSFVPKLKSLNINNID